MKWNVNGRTMDGLKIYDPQYSFLSHFHAQSNEQSTNGMSSDCNGRQIESKCRRLISI